MPQILRHVYIVVLRAGVIHHVPLPLRHAGNNITSTLRHDRQSHACIGLYRIIRYNPMLLFSRQIMATRKRRSRRHQLSWTAQRVSHFCYTFLLFLVSNVFWQRCDAVRRSELAERKRKARGCAKVCLLFAFHVNAAVCERVCCSLNCLHRLQADPKSSFERFRRFAASVSFARRALRPAQQLCTTSGTRFLSLKGSSVISFAQR